MILQRVVCSKNLNYHKKFMTQALTTNAIQKVCSEDFSPSEIIGAIKKVCSEDFSPSEIIGAIKKVCSEDFSPSEIIYGC